MNSRSDNMALSEPDGQFMLMLIEWTGVLILATGIGFFMLFLILGWSYEKTAALWGWLLLGAAGLIYIRSPQGGLNIMVSLAIAINAGVWAFSGCLQLEP